MKRLLPLALAAALGAVGTAAAISLPAGADDDFESSTRRAGARLPSTFRVEWRRFADCMREHGFDVSGDATVRVTPDGVTVNGKEVDAEAFRAAERDCGPPWRGVGRGEPRLDGLPGRAELEARRDAFLADVAGRLGVTAAQLKDALRDAAVARIDELERAGEITAAEAEHLRERARSGELPLARPPHPHGPPLLFRHFGERRHSSGAFEPPDLPSAA